MLATVVVELALATVWPSSRVPLLAAKVRVTTVGCGDRVCPRAQRGILDTHTAPR